MHDTPLAPAGSLNSVTLLVPGDLNLRTGGYGYDREIVAGLRALGWQVEVLLLDETFPSPTPEARAHAVRALAALPDGRLVLADGLAFGAMPEEAEAEAHRLNLVGLVHHPLADETGLDATAAQRLMASERRALAATRGVVVTSQATAERLAAFAVEAGRIAVVAPGTAPAPLARGTRGFDAAATTNAAGHAGSRPPVELLCVATLVPRKGHDVLFAALARLRHLQWHLTCAGSDRLSPSTASALRERLSASGLTERVTLAGDLDAAALADAYDRADLFVLATRHEGYGMAVAEAVARGLPVVSTYTGAIPELVGRDSGVLLQHDHIVGWTYNLGLLLSPDWDLRERLAEGARRRRDRLPRWPDSARAMADALTRFAGHGILQR